MRRILIAAILVVAGCAAPFPADVTPRPCRGCRSQRRCERMPDLGGLRETGHGVQRRGRRIRNHVGSDRELRCAGHLCARTRRDVRAAVRDGSAGRFVARAGRPSSTRRVSASCCGSAARLDLGAARPRGMILREGRRPQLLLPMPETDQAILPLLDADGISRGDGVIAGWENLSLPLRRRILIDRAQIPRTPTRHRTSGSIQIACGACAPCLSTRRQRVATARRNDWP